MQTIYYPNNFGQPSWALYGLAASVRDFSPFVDIVVINTHRLGATSFLCNCERGLNILLNKVLSSDLKGVRTEFVRLFVLQNAKASPLSGFEAPIFLDEHDYFERGNPYLARYSPFPAFGKILARLGIGEVRRTLFSTDIVGGCAQFYTRIDESRTLSSDEIKSLCDSVGFDAAEALRTAS